MSIKTFFVFVLSMLLLNVQYAAADDESPPVVAIYIGQDAGVHNDLSYTYEVYATLYNYDAESGVTSCEINWGDGWEGVYSGAEAAWYSISHTYGSAGTKNILYRCSSAGGSSEEAEDSITILQDTTPALTAIYLGGADGVHNNNIFSTTVYANMWSNDPESPVTFCRINWNDGSGLQDVQTGQRNVWRSVSHAYSAVGTKRVDYICGSDGGIFNGSVQHTNWDSIELSSAQQQAASSLASLPKKILRISKLFFSEECVSPGQELRLMSSFDIDRDLENVKITATVAELGLRKSLGPFDLKKDDSKSLFMTIPDGTPAGEYDLRVVVDADGFKRIKHREFKVKREC